MSSICTPGGGLGKTGSLLRRGGRVSVAYLGGSITQAGKSRKRPFHGWRGYTTEWLQSAYPGANIVEVNAGIGGTSSALGVFRAKSDVLAFSPDLIFVEFVVNDEECDEHTSISSMEGIVRQALQHENRPQLCFVYTVNEPYILFYKAGKLPDRLVWHEKVARRYAIPSINIGRPIAEKIIAGRLEWRSFAPDGTHPSPEGFALYRDLVIEQLRTLLQMPQVNSPSAPPSQLSNLDLAGADIAYVKESDAQADWIWTGEKLTKGWARFGNVLAAEYPAHPLRLNFSGRSVGLYYVVGPESGDIECAIDGGDFKKYRIFDRHSQKFYRPYYQVLTHDLAEGSHTIDIRMCEQKPPNSRGRKFWLGGLLVRR
ncbi:MAG: hypothetical protein GF398_11330 [Chitinivibrionales bacterium]|nr:hypothetical protein [Chitinivibrionales bacterium]